MGAATDWWTDRRGGWTYRQEVRTDRRGGRTGGEDGQEGLEGWGRARLRRHACARLRVCAPVRGADPPMRVYLRNLCRCLTRGRWNLSLADLPGGGCADASPRPGWRLRRQGKHSHESGHAKHPRESARDLALIIHRIFVDQALRVPGCRGGAARGRRARTGSG